MRKKIAAKVVVILNATSLFGETIAKHLALEGAILALGSPDAAALNELAKELMWEGTRVLAFETDAAESPQSVRLAEAANTAFGRIDVLVNCPPLASLSPAAVTIGNMDSVADMYMLSAIHGVLAVLPHMPQRGMGQIIN